MIRAALCRRGFPRRIVAKQRFAALPESCSDVCPRPIVDNGPARGFRNPVPRRYRSNSAPSRRIALMPLTFQRLFGRIVEFAYQASLPADHIGDVICLGSVDEVIWVYALAIIAGVPDHRFARKC